MGRVIFHPMMVDWSNREVVIEYAKSFGHKVSGLTVVKLPTRSNYNIVHTNRENEMPEGTEFVWRSKKEGI